jgi:hypothetical protein
MLALPSFGARRRRGLMTRLRAKEYLEMSLW